MLASRPPSVLSAARRRTPPSSAAGGSVVPRPPVPSRERRRVRSSASPSSSSPTSSTATTPPKKPIDPFRDVPPTVYQDSWLDSLLIGLFTRKLAAAAGVPATLPAGGPRRPVVYEDFVRVARDDIMARSPLAAQAQRDLVLSVLLSLLPPGLPAAFRTLFPPTQLSAELNARIAAATFSWLVGEMELREGEVVVARAAAAARTTQGGGGGGGGGAGGSVRETRGSEESTTKAEQGGAAEDQTRVQRSIVHIKRCRFLESSACAGACVQMCKLPTQEFFAREFGLPLTMTPNFDDLSCDMVFGQVPPAMADDPALAQPCFSLVCPTAVGKAPACPQVLAAAGVTGSGGGGSV